MNCVSCGAAACAELGIANESLRQLRTELYECHAENDQLKSQLEAMRRSRDELAKRLEAR